MVREPVVDGQFYPRNEDELRSYLGGVFTEDEAKVEAMGVMVPHAGYVYSGAVAAKVFSRVVVPPTVILLGPNHTGLGERAAVYAKGSWKTPLGEVPIEENLAMAILATGAPFSEDETAHKGEHSLEVILPFLQRVQPNLAIVPIAFMLRDIADIEEAGREIGRTLASWGEKALIVVSSDMTHYESAKAAKEKDSLAISKLETLDPQGLLNTVARYSISMCGVVPASVLLFALKELGATAGKEIAYATSGDTSGDFEHVVGYEGMIFI